MAKRTLAEIVKEREDKTKCLLCEIPEREEIESLRRDLGKKMKLVDVETYLVEDRGYDYKTISHQRKNKMAEHFYRHMKKESDD